MPVLLAAVVTVGCLGCGSKPSLYTSAAGKYSVMLPGRPTEKDENVATPIGPITAHTAIAEDGRRVGYGVVFADYPPNLVQSGNVDAILEGACNGKVAAISGQITDKRTIAVDGHPGRRIRFNARVPEEANGISKIFLVNNRLYDVFVVGTPATLDATAADAFLDSFKLNDGIPAAAPTPAATQPAQAQAPAAATAEWGTPEDPDHDSQIKVEGAAATIVVPGGIHNLVTPPGQANAPRIMRPVEGDCFAEVKVADGLRPADPAAPGANVPFQGAGLVLWGDAGDFIRLESAAVSRGGQVHAYILFEHHRTGAPAMDQGAQFAGGPVWLRLERRGNQVTAWYNTDGTNWIALRPMDFAAPRASAGVAAVNTAAAPFPARFEGLRVGKP